jgi:hypothetical protein
MWAVKEECDLDTESRRASAATRTRRGGFGARVRAWGEGEGWEEQGGVAVGRV